MNINTITKKVEAQYSNEVESMKHETVSKEIQQEFAAYKSRSIQFGMGLKRDGMKETMAKTTFGRDAKRDAESFDKQCKKAGDAKKAQAKKVNSKPAPFNVKATALTLYKKQTKAEIKALIAELSALIA